MCHHYHPSNFDMILFWYEPTNVGKRRAVCFSKDRYIIFKELDESGEQGCMILSYDANDNDILINDCTKVSKIALSVKYTINLNGFN